jgi:hypothetical protein
MRRTLGLIAVSVAFGLAGCSNPAAVPPVATAQSPGAASPTPSVSSVVAQYIEAKRKWVACMREQSFPLPDPDAKGNVDLSQAKLPVKTDPKLLAAMQKCQEFLLPVPEELVELPAMTAQQIEWSRAYSKCVRDNGLLSFPDPGPDGYLPRDYDPGQLTEQEAQASIRAHDICAPVSEGGQPRPYDPNRPTQG